MFSSICPWTNSWANNGDAGDLRRHLAHYNVTVTEASLKNMIEWTTQVKHRKSPTTPMFAQQLVKTNTKVNTKALYYWPFVRELVVHRWIHKRSVMQKAFSCHDNFIFLQISAEPSAPEGLNVDSVTTDSITISWSAPTSTGGKKIKRYVVYIKEVTETKYRKVTKVKSETTTVTLDSLKEGTEYLIQVFAENEIGVSKQRKYCYTAIDSGSVLIWAMDWHLTDDKPLPEPNVAKL